MRYSKAVGKARLVKKYKFPDSFSLYPCDQISEKFIMDLTSFVARGLKVCLRVLTTDNARNC